MSTKPIFIRPAIGTGKLTEDAFLARINAVDKGLDNNPAYPAQPVSPVEFKAAVAGYAVAHAAAL